MDHIQATFGGKPATFYLSRKRMAQGVYGDAYDHLRRYIDGRWTAKDMQAFLIDTYRDADGFADLSTAMRLVPETLERNGPGHYVGLCAKVFEAALFGVTEANGVFDEAQQLASEPA